MRSVRVSRSLFPFAAGAALGLGILASVFAGTFKPIDLSTYMRQHGARAFQGILSQKRFLPFPDAGREGVYETYFTLNGISLHDGKSATITVRFLGGTGADAAIYSTSATPQNLKEGDRVLAYLLPGGTANNWRLEAFPMVHKIVQTQTGEVAIADVSSAFFKSNRRVEDVRGEIESTARSLGIK